MKNRDGVLNERVDAVDENILLTLKEGEQSLKNPHTLSRINHNTFRLQNPVISLIFPSNGLRSILDVLTLAYGGK